MHSNRVKNIALLGVSGQQGSEIARELLKAKAGQFNLYAITREDSSSQIPDGFTAKRVNYDRPETIVEALKGMDVFIVTLSVSAPPGTEPMIYKAACEAEVPFIVPSEWAFGLDEGDGALVTESMVHEAKVANRALIRSFGTSAYIAVAYGFRYVWTLSNGPPMFGFSFPRKELIFFDDGTAKVNVTTVQAVGVAVAALVSLPVEKEDGYTGKVLSDYKDSVVYISSFLLSQRDMFASVLRVTGDKESDWTITHENSKERYDAGIKSFQGGNRSGLSVAVHTRMLYPDGSGDFESKHPLANADLGLPKENLDARTKEAIEASKTSPYGRL